MQQDDLARRLGILGFRSLDLVLVPCLCLTGIITNGVCFVILRQLGLGRNYNLMLMCISISSVVFMFNSVNIVGLACKYSSDDDDDEEFASDDTLCRIPDTVVKANAMYSFCFLQRCLSEAAYVCLFIFPSIGTLERVVAVYFPLNLKRIVTRRGIVNACIFIVTTIITLEFAFIFNEYEIINKPRNVTQNIIAQQRLDIEVPTILRRESRNEGLVFFARHVWLWIYPFVIGTHIVFGSILVVFKVTCNNKATNQLSRNQGSIKKRNREVLRSLLTMNFTYVLLDCSWIIKIHNNSFTEERYRDLTAASQILAMLDGNARIFVHLLIDSKFRQTLVKTFNSLNKIGPLKSNVVIQNKRSLNHKF